MSTPYFPQWRPRLAALGRRVHHLRHSTLGELEGFFAGCWAPELLEGGNGVRS